MNFIEAIEFLKQRPFSKICNPNWNGKIGLFPSDYFFLKPNGRAPVRLRDSNEREVESHILLSWLLVNDNNWQEYIESVNIKK